MAASSSKNLVDGLRRGKLETRIRWWFRNEVLQSDVAFPSRHIDEFQKKYLPKRTWFDGGLECFKSAIALRDAEYPSFGLELLFELRMSIKRKGMNIRSWPELQNDFDRSPPEIYAYRPDLWNYTCRRFGKRTTALDAGIDHARYYFKERYDAVEELYVRFFAIVSPPVKNVVV